MTVNINVKNNFLEMKEDLIKEKIPIKFDEQYAFQYTNSIKKNRKRYISSTSKTETGLNNHGTPIHSELALSRQKNKPNIPQKTTDVYWYTKNSPCLTPSAINEKSCFTVILDQCKEWFGEKPFAGRCYVGFEKYWGFNGHPFRDIIEKFQSKISDISDDVVRRNIFWSVLEDKKFLKGHENFENYVSFVFLG